MSTFTPENSPNKLQPLPKTVSKEEINLDHEEE